MCIRAVFRAIFSRVVDSLPNLYKAWPKLPRAVRVEQQPEEHIHPSLPGAPQGTRHPPHTKLLLPPPPSPRGTYSGTTSGQAMASASLYNGRQILSADDVGFLLHRRLSMQVIWTSLNSIRHIKTRRRHLSPGVLGFYPGGAGILCKLHKLLYVDNVNSWQKAV